MCGIIAVLRRRSRRPSPSGDEIVKLVGDVSSLLTTDHAAAEMPRVLERAAGDLERADAALRGVPGVRALIDDPACAKALDDLTRSIDASLVGLSDALADAADADAVDHEAFYSMLGRVRDRTWAISRDRLRTADAVRSLAGADAGLAALEVFTSVQEVLSAIDRLEVRGRDSAGIHILVTGHGLDLGSPAVAAMLEDRTADPLFASMTVRVADEMLGFVYKAAAEIGELGDNTRALRDAITSDVLLHAALVADGARGVVTGHTRWASIGIISQPNAHPVDSLELSRRAGPYVTAVLNGDVDNFADLKLSEGLSIAAEITTDAKVIPTIISRHIDAGADPKEAFREALGLLDGSVAVTASTAVAPDDLLLGVRGSGQALYVGLAEDAFIVASEPYGVVEQADVYLRVDGEALSDPTNPASRGQVIALSGQGAGTLDGISRWAYDGTALPVDESELVHAEITTRDIDRGDFPHYLLKEISESPGSFRKTLASKLVEVDGAMQVRLGEPTLPQGVRSRLADGSIRRIFVIGQGTASVAGQSFVGALALAAPGCGVPAQALPATELSGFSLDADMSDALVIAISQSGTTTDTNRTVDLVRARGASVVAVVNRRGSDLTDKADGVLYTSDGRDVEMSVASTKAFYSQIAACFLLAFAVADGLRCPVSDEREAILRELAALPDRMVEVLGSRDVIAQAAHRFAPARRYWAIVGNGVNRIAAQEIRIKLSELCYKAIACDVTEDKKHIDLSSEPMILVCAAGLSGSTADDVAKEVAIFRAHKAAPVVIATEGEGRFGAALQAIFVPRTHPGLAFVLAAMAGHLFGYEAALAIDAQARPLREVRAAIEQAVSATRATEDPDALAERLVPTIAPHATRFADGLRSGDYDGHLEASTAVRVSSLMRYALGVAPLESYQVEFGKVGTPSVIIEDLTDALSSAIEQLTRPIDAIKHQAKTVTVGISRSDETLLQVPLVAAVLATGVARDSLSYSTLRTLAALEPLVDEVLGYTRYAIEGELGSTGGDEPRVSVVDRGGLGRELRSRTEAQPVLRGTKHHVATERQVLLARGRSDQRTVLIVPEVKDGQATGLVLLHVSIAEDLGVDKLRSILSGYRSRYAALRDAVTETEPTFRDDLLTTVPVVDLMTEPINDLADRWRT